MSKNINNTLENFEDLDGQPDLGNLVFFDTETVGLRPNYIVSIAYIVYRDGKQVKGGYLICNPDYPIGEQASKVNGFTNESVKDKPLFPEIWSEIRPYFEGSIWVGHNVKFDESAITLECRRYGIPIPKHWTICTCDNAKKLIPKSVVGNYKLNTLCDYFGIEFHNHHTASFDTVACRKVFNKLVELSDGNLTIKDEVL